MQKSNHEREIGDVISKVLDRFNLKPKLNEIQLRSAWARIMGKNVSQYTTDIYIKNKTLFIKLSSPALRDELSYSKEKLKNIINEELGSEQIQRIMFV
ncbi:MAG: DUF721 domain-containing protein [Bacteroidota bacterium]